MNNDATLQLIVTTAGIGELDNLTDRIHLHSRYGIARKFSCGWPHPRAKSGIRCLGAFAVTSDEESSSDTDPTMCLQMAISKDGVLLSGSFQNRAIGTVNEIEGMVDKQTQRAAWTAVGETRPIMATGMRNRTQDAVPTPVHFADRTTQQWSRALYHSIAVERSLFD